MQAVRMAALVDLECLAYSMVVQAEETALVSWLWVLMAALEFAFFHIVKP
jgi:hypothetical protein